MAAQNARPRASIRRRIWRSAAVLASAVTLALALFAGWFGVGGPTSRIAGTTTTMGSPNEPVVDQTPRTDTTRASRGDARSPVPTASGSPAGTAPAAGTLPSAKPTTEPTIKPTALAIVTKGSGAFTAAPGHSPRVGTGPLIRYQVEIERELPFSPTEVARVVDQTLRDKRSWAAAGKATFERVDGGPVELHILIATPGTTDRLCAPLRTIGELSCRNGDRVMINAKRWAGGAEAFGTDVANYRRYVVNHEVGHRLGRDHLSCGGAGEPAPVMMQQTKGVDECRPNPWPLPSELAS